MFGYAILATLVAGGLVFALDDDDDGTSEPEFSDGQRETYLPDFPTSESLDATATAQDNLLFAGHDGGELHGEAGADSIFGGNGDDALTGGEGNDTLFGFEGDDDLVGENGRDGLYGNAGNDTLFGASGQDVLLGGADDDLLNGGSFGDYLLGGHGQDTLNGGTGNDTLYGVEFGDDPTEVEITDFLDGDSRSIDFALDVTGDTDGADVIHGGDGDDVIYLGAGDTVTGGSGSDRFFLLTDASAEGPAYITDFDPDEDGILTLFIEATVGEAQASDFIVEEDADTGDALLTQDGVVLARIADAAGRLGSENLLILAV